MKQLKKRRSASLPNGFTVICYLIFFGFFAINSAQATDKQQWQWDFDHKVSYKKTSLKNNQYLLEIMPKIKTTFNIMATFMIRKSYQLCHHQYYTLEILKGVQTFNDVQGAPNRIMSSLKAKITCKSTK